LLRPVLLSLSVAHHIRRRAFHTEGPDMPGLSLEARYDLVRLAERRALESPRIPGTRRLALTPCDTRVLRVLCFDFHNSRTGRTDPGYRAIARRAAVALGTVSASIGRLAAAGFLTFERRLLRVASRWLRWTHAYTLAAAPLRSTFAPKPLEVSRRPRRTSREARELPPIPDPGRDLLAARRAAVEARWRLGRQMTPG
jgi:hypothetical protein